MLAAANKAVGGRDRVRETGTHSLHVERRAVVLDAELVLQQTRRTRKHEIRCGRGDDNEIDGLRIDVSGFDRALRSDQRKIACRDIRLSEMARMDTRAGNDPFVARLDALAGEAFSQFLIGDTAGRQIAAGAQHTGVNSRLSHYAFEGNAA